MNIKLFKVFLKGIVILLGSYCIIAANPEADESARWDFIRRTFEVKGEKVYAKSHRKITVFNARGDEYANLYFDESPFEKIKKLKIEMKDFQNEIIKSYGIKDLEKHCGFGAAYDVYRDICYYVFSEIAPRYPYSIEVTEEKEYTNRFNFRGTSLPTKVPITSVVCSLVCPRDIPIRYKSYALPLSTESVIEQNKQNIVWSGDDIHALDFDTLNTLEYEWAGSIIAIIDKFEFINSSYSGGSWADIGRWYAELIRQRYNWNRIKHNGAENSNRLEVCKNAFDGIIGDYRYVSISIGVGGWRPRLIDSITKTRYGDCKDLSMLLISELRKQNVEAYPVLILTRGNGIIDSTFPGFQFNHLITVAVSGNDTLWMDPTCRNCPFGQIPWADQNTYALIVSDTAGILVQTPGSTAEENKIVRKVNATMNSNGLLESEITFEYTGQYGSLLRDSFSHLTGSELTRFVESLLAGKSMTYEVRDYSVENLTDNYEPFILNFNAVSVSPARKIRNVIYLDPCVVEPGLNFATSDYDRIRPLKLSYPRTIIDSVQITFDTTMMIDSIAFSSTNEYSSALGHWSITWTDTESTTPNKINLTMQYGIDKIYILPEQFDALKELSSVIESRDNRLVKIYTK